VQISSLRHLSESEPLRASELIIAAMQNRLNRAAGAAAGGNTGWTENALRHFVRYSGLAEEILDNYAGTEAGMNIAELCYQAQQTQQQFFNSFCEKISPYLAGEVNMAFQKMEQKHGQDSGNQDQQPGNQGQNSGNQGQDSGDQGQEPGNQGQDSGDQGQEPGNQDQDSGNQDQGSGNQDQGQGGQTTDNGNGGGNSSGGQQGN